MKTKNNIKISKDEGILIFPMLKSQSVGNLQRKTIKNNASNLLKNGSQNNEHIFTKKMNDYLLSLEFREPQEKKLKKSIISIQINEQEEVNEQMRKLGYKMRQKKLQQTYHTIDLWKSKYSLEQRRKKQSSKLFVPKIEQNKSITEQQRELLRIKSRRQKTRKTYLQESILEEQQKKNDLEKSFKRFMKHSPNTKNPRMIPSLIQFQVKKANYSKINKKSKVVLQKISQKEQGEKSKEKKKKQEKKEQKQKIEQSPIKQKILKVDYFKEGQIPTKWEINNRYEEQENMLYENIEPIQNKYGI